MSTTPESIYGPEHDARVAAFGYCGDDTCDCTGMIDEYYKERVIAVDRDETDTCEAGTPGCCIDHSRDTFDSCETW